MIRVVGRKIDGRCRDHDAAGGSGQKPTGQIMGANPGSKRASCLRKLQAGVRFSLVVGSRADGERAASPVPAGAEITH